MMQKLLKVLKQKSDTILLMVYILAGLLFSIILLRYNYFVCTDGAVYLISGRNLAWWHHYPVTWFPPFYPLLIAFVFKLSGHLELSGHLVSMMAYALSIVIFFKLAELIYDRKRALVATFLYFSHGLMLAYSYRVLSHAVDIFLIISLMYVACRLLKARSRRLRYVCLLGVLSAFGILNRLENLPIAAGLIGLTFRSFQANTRGRIKRLLMLLFVAGIILFPYMRFLHSSTGQWTLSAKPASMRIYDQAYSGNIRNEEMAIDDGFKNFDLKKYLVEKHGIILTRYTHNFKRMIVELGKILYGGLGFLLAGLGWKNVIVNDGRGRFNYILLATLIPLPFIPLAKISPRMFIFILPAILLWITNGIFHLSAFFSPFFGRGKRLPILMVGAILLILVSVNVFYTISEDILPIRNRATEHIAMGNWMKQNIPGIQHVLIASRKPFVSLYAGCRYTSVPFSKGYDEFISNLKRQNIEYLIVDERYFGALRPHLKFLLDETVHYPGLEKIYVIHQPQKIILYKLS